MLFQITKKVKKSIICSLVYVLWNCIYIPQNNAKLEFHQRNTFKIYRDILEYQWIK